jgi:hypothetical protein
MKALPPPKKSKKIEKIYNLFLLVEAAMTFI